VRKQHQNKISNRIAGLENLNVSGKYIMKLNITLQLFLNAGDVNIMGISVHTNKNTESLVVATKEIGLKVTADKTKYMAVSRSECRTKSQYKE
jgi:hypothetical protein